MKAISVILVLIFAIMACYPCVDVGRKTSFSKYDQHEAKVNDPQDVSSADFDICSPLCYCDCCSCQVTQPSGIYFSLIVPITITCYSSLRNPSIRSISLDIWQPPKIS